MPTHLPFRSRLFPPHVHFTYVHRICSLLPVTALRYHAHYFTTVVLVDFRSHSCCPLPITTLFTTICYAFVTTARYGVVLYSLFVVTVPTTLFVVRLPDPLLRYGFHTILDYLPVPSRTRLRSFSRFDLFRYPFDVYCYADLRLLLLLTYVTVVFTLPTVPFVTVIYHPGRMRSADHTGYLRWRCPFAPAFLYHHAPTATLPHPDLPTPLLLPTPCHTFLPHTLPLLPFGYETRGFTPTRFPTRTLTFCLTHYLFAYTLPPECTVVITVVVCSDLRCCSTFTALRPRSGDSHRSCSSPFLPAFYVCYVRSGLPHAHGCCYIPVRTTDFWIPTVILPIYWCIRCTHTRIYTHLHTLYTTTHHRTHPCILRRFVPILFSIVDWMTVVFHVTLIHYDSALCVVRIICCCSLYRLLPVLTLPRSPPHTTIYHHDSPVVHHLLPTFIYVVPFYTFPVLTVDHVLV